MRTKVRKTSGSTFKDDKTMFKAFLLKDFKHILQSTNNVEPTKMTTYCKNYTTLKCLRIQKMLDKTPNPFLSAEIGCIYTCIRG